MLRSNAQPRRAKLFRSRPADRRGNPLRFLRGGVVWSDADSSWAPVQVASKARAAAEAERTAERARAGGSDSGRIHRAALPRSRLAAMMELVV